MREARELVAKGVDPSAERKEAVKKQSLSVTFKEVSDAYLKSRVGNVSHHHYERSESLLRLYAVTAFGRTPIDDISHKDIKPLIVNLSEKGKKASAKKLFGVLKQVFDYAEMKDHVEVNVCNLLNPTTLIKDYVPKSHATITKAEDIKLLMKNIKNYEGHYTTKMALEFMAYTALRSYNVRAAKWKYIKDGVMTIPKEEMKIAKDKLENAVDFKLPLSKQSLALLEEMRPISGHGTYIFPSIRGDRPMSENALLAMVRNLGYTKDQFTPHGFRSMFSTISNEEGEFNLEIIDAQLAHKVGNAVSSTYNKASYIEKRKVCLNGGRIRLESL